MTAPTIYSIEELATRVLRDLGLGGAEETPTAADMAWAIETCQSEIQLLLGKSIPLWNGSNIAIPLQYYTTVSRRCGLAVATAFGLIDVASATVAMEAAERDLRILAMTGPTGEVAVFGT